MKIARPGLEGTKLVFDSYRARRAELGLPRASRDRFAYAALVYTGETDEDAIHVSMMPSMIGQPGGAVR